MNRIIMKKTNKNSRFLLINQMRFEITYEYMFYTGLQKFRSELLEAFPTMERWLPKEVFDLKPLWPDRLKFSIRDYNSSPSCSFLADNLETPTDLMIGNITPDMVLTKLERAKNKGNPYSHVGFSVFMSGYSQFVETAKAIRKYDPTITTIAGNVGALFPGTEKYVDMIGRGDGVRFLRDLFHEDVNRPYNLEVIPAANFFTLYGVDFKTELAQIVTKLGCPNNCDFCVTTKLFDGKFTKALFSPQLVHDKIVEYRRNMKKDIAILLCEPQGIIQKKWWYELFDLFNDEPEDYPLMAAASVASLKKFDFERISNSSLRFYGFNVGLESFSKHYDKNIKHRETKQILDKLKDYGIATYATFIIGFDHHTHESVWEEIKRVVDLDIYGITVHNLKILPETPLWVDYQKNGLLLDIPYDFYYIEGFQSYTHPHFKPGFEDMLPLTYKIYEYIERERGTSLLSFMELLKNIPKQRPIFEKRYNLFRNVSSLIFPSWKEHLVPTQEQIDRYLQRLNGVTRPPLYLRMFQKSNLFRKVLKTFV